MKTAIYDTVITTGFACLASDEQELTITVTLQKNVLNIIAMAIAEKC